LLRDRTGTPPADSALEQRVIRLLAPYGPFETQYQIVVDGIIVILDIAWPIWRVGVEADGWSVRSRSRGKFDRDRRKANLLAANSWSIAHVTSTMSDSEIISAVSRLLPPWAATGS
jgi:hypothetical protein